jgi:hypothetical protein
MQFVLRNSANRKKIEAIEKKLFLRKSSNGFDSKKYNGLLHLMEDPLAIQLTLRNEWEPSPSNIF